MTVFKTARERAEDAQSAFIAFLVAGQGSRDEFRILLESVFSTMQIAENSAYGVVARTSHVAYSKRIENKMFFETLEAQVWRLHAAGTAPEVVYGAVRSAGATKKFNFLPYDALVARLRAHEQSSPRLAYAR